MILGVSHIVVTTDDLDADAAKLSAEGWKEGWRDRLAPHAGKNRFLARPSAGETLAYFQRAGHPARELIRYDGGISPCAPRVADFGPAEEGRPPGLRIFTDNPSASRRFWREAVGFAEDGTDRPSARLRLTRPMAAWSLGLEVIERPGLVTDGSTLDAGGIRCVAFLVSDLDRDRVALLEGGALASTGPLAYHVGGRSISVEIFLAPGGMHVELLQVRTATR